MAQELHLSKSDIAGMVAGIESIDRRHAQQVGRNYAEYWLSKAKGLVDESTNPRQAARAATSASEWRSTMVAANETTSAYTLERAQIGRMAAPMFDGLGLVPYRVWCSEREKNTCSRCYAAHGEIVPMGERFSLGEPGDPHVNCHCWDDVIWLPASYANV